MSSTDTSEKLLDPPVAMAFGAMADRIKLNPRRRSKPSQPAVMAEQPQKRKHSPSSAPAIDRLKEEDMDSVIVSQTNPSLESSPAVKVNLESEIEIAIAAPRAELPKNSIRTRSKTSVLSPFKSPKAKPTMTTLIKSSPIPIKKMKPVPRTPANIDFAPIPKSKYYSAAEVKARGPDVRNDPKNYHVDQNYLLLEHEVILLRPDTDRKELQKIFDTPYKLHPSRRPFKLTQEEHVAMWKNVADEEAKKAKEV